MQTNPTTRAPGPRSAHIDAAQYAPTWATLDAADAEAMDALEAGTIDETEYSVVEAAANARAAELRALFPAETAARSVAYVAEQCRGIR